MILDQLTELEEESKARGIPIIGKEKGAWLLQKIHEEQPTSILELGTANGYSGTILGSTGATLTTIEQNQELAREAATNFQQYGINANILIGNGIHMINELPDESFDLVFIDFAKKAYMKILEDTIRVTKTGGSIIADNITMEGCKDFKAAIENEPRLQTEIIMIRDGMSWSKKL